MCRRSKKWSVSTRSSSSYGVWGPVAEDSMVVGRAEVWAVDLVSDPSLSSPSFLNLLKPAFAVQLSYFSPST